MEENPMTILNGVEQKAIQLLEIASKVCSMLSELDATHTDEITQLTSQFFAFVKEIQLSLRKVLEQIADNNPYRNTISSYGSRKDLEIIAMRTDLAIKQLHGIRNLLKQETPTQMDTS